MKYDKKYLKKINEWYNLFNNDPYLSRHPELESFDMPKTFYFRYLPERSEMHWAIIKKEATCAKIYFIESWGRVFDILEFKNEKIARRRLRRNGFYFSTNKYCPFTPNEPIYIKLSQGNKSAPYSKGTLWQSVKRDEKHFNKIEKSYFNLIISHYERCQEIFKEYNRPKRKQTKQQIIKQNKPSLFQSILKWAGFILIVHFICGLLMK